MIPNIYEQHSGCPDANEILIVVTQLIFALQSATLPEKHKSFQRLALYQWSFHPPYWYIPDPVTRHPPPSLSSHLSA